MEHSEKIPDGKLVEQQQIERDTLFSTCALAGDDIYAFTHFKRLPIKWNLKEKEMVLLKDVKDYDVQFSADGMLGIGHNIYVLEFNGNRLMQFNTAEKTCKYYEIGCHKEEWGNYAAFVQWKGVIYIFPKYQDKLIKFEILSERITEINNLYLKVGSDKRKYNPSKGDQLFEYGFQSQNIVWLFQKQSDLVFTYDLESDTWGKHELSERINDCIHAIQRNGYLYILSSEGKVYCLNIAKNSIRVLTDCREGKAESDLFLRIAVTDRNIYILPALGEDIFCVNLENEQTTKYKAFPSSFKYCAPKHWGKYYGYCEDENYYYFAMRSMNFIPCINKKTGLIEWIKLRLPRYEEYIWDYVSDNKKQIAERECRMIDMIEYLKSQNEKKQEKRDFVTVGERIYKQMK